MLKVSYTQSTKPINSEERLMYTFLYLHFLWKYWVGERFNIKCMNTLQYELLIISLYKTYINKNKYLLTEDRIQKYMFLPVLTDIFWAIIRPPITASPVQRAWPKIPPNVTPITSYNKEITWNIIPHHWLYICQQYYKV